jgi:nitrite reductase/ring-hydroxylating ferredoxin subunit
LVDQHTVIIGRSVTSSADSRPPDVEAVVVARSEDVPERERVVVEVDGTEIGIFRVRAGLYAYANYCPHAGGPVCQGLLINRVVERLDDRRRSLGDDFSEDVHVVCPWHGYEFDLVTGRHPGRPATRLRSYRVWELDGEIRVEL